MSFTIPTFLRPGAASCYEPQICQEQFPQLFEQFFPIITPNTWKTVAIILLLARIPLGPSFLSRVPRTCLHPIVQLEDQMTPTPTTDSQPPPPIRTSTNSSAISQTSSMPTSPGYSAQASPKSYISRSSTQGSPSPTDSSFFEALASKVRRGRSRSRSRKGVPRHRSKSPLPPEQLPVSSEFSQMSPPSSPRAQQQSRHFSDASRSSTNSNNDHPKQPPPGPVRRNTASSDPWRGRHSNSWLFNDFSVTDHVKEFCHIGKNSRP